MSVLGRGYGTSLQGERKAPAEEKGVIGKAFRGLVAGSVFGAALALGISTAPANAATLEPLVAYLDSPFSNNTQTKPSPDAPGGEGDWWLRAMFEDMTTHVKLTLTANFTSGNFAHGLWLNLSEGDVAGYSFDPAGGVNISSNTHNADGDGLFDVEIDLDQFASGDLSWNISHDTKSISEILAGIMTFSSPQGGYGPYMIAAHIGNITEQTDDDGRPTDSTWITGDINPIPLPPAALLFLTGLAGMGLLARRRRASLGGAA